MSGRQRRQSIPPHFYDTEYFLTECEGWGEFLQSKGELLPERLRYAFAIADIRPGMRVLDAGFGRGELLLHCCRAGAHVFGVDYSLSALELARATLRNCSGRDASSADIVCADIKCLPFPDNSFDRVFALDVVEHLHGWELDQALREIHRALTPHGRLIVHTMPNRWYYAIGYPLYRVFQRFRGRSLPKDPRQRWKFVPKVHVNEQDPLSLKKALARANFSAKIWLQPMRSPADEEYALESIVKRFLSTVFPLKLIFCSDIFAIAKRKTIEESMPDNLSKMG